MPLPSGLIICFLSKSRFLQTHFCDQSQSHCPYCQLGRAPVLTAAYTGHSHPCSCCFLDNPALFWFSRHISLWGSISFNLAVFINLAVALFYPFGDDGDEGTLSPMFSVLLWVAVAICTSMLFFFSKPVGIRPFLVSVMLRSIYTIGLGPTLILLGAANVSTLLSFVSYGIQTY